MCKNINTSLQSFSLLSNFYFKAGSNGEKKGDDARPCRSSRRRKGKFNICFPYKFSTSIEILPVFGSSNRRLEYTLYVYLQIKLLLSVVRAYDVPVRCDMDPLQSQSNLQIQVQVRNR